MPLPADFDPDAPALATDGLFGLPFTEDDAAVVVVPVPFEATASSGRGTSGAPAAIAEASRQVDLHDPLVEEPWRAGIAMAPVDPELERLASEANALAAPILEAGGPSDATAADLARVNAIGDEVNRRVYDATRRILDRGAIPAILGGDHSVPFGAIRATAERHPGMGILHIDAHADLREAYMGFTWSHASIMYNVHQRIPGVGKLVQVGIRDFARAESDRIAAWSKVTAFTDHELAWEHASGEPWMRTAARIVRPLPRDVWVSFDIDGLDPALCPGTGTPVPGGLGWRHTQLLLQLLAQDHRIIGFDLCEVGTSQLDANIGARLLYRLASWAIDGRTSR